jgi:hypothetical protein
MLKRMIMSDKYAIMWEGSFRDSDYRLDIRMKTLRNNLSHNNWYIPNVKSITLV